MPRKRTEGLTERETEILAVLWQLEQASVEDIRLRLAGQPAASTVRSLLSIMTERGLVAHDDTVYAKKYRPKLDRNQAQDSALQRLIDRLFAGSTEALLVRLVDEGAVDDAQLERLQQRLQQRRQQSQ
ncbi:MAG: hypothetical protein GKR89_23955 [Candidatus Latescibacteria bacterium]|nr:hypothetical protein [Candidatus Latescibacterota bacterium]